MECLFLDSLWKQQRRATAQKPDHWSAPTNDRLRYSSGETVSPISARVGQPDIQNHGRKLQQSPGTSFQQLPSSTSKRRTSSILKQPNLRPHPPPFRTKPPFCDRSAARTSGRRRMRIMLQWRMESSCCSSHWIGFVERRLAKAPLLFMRESELFIVPSCRRRARWWWPAYTSILVDFLLDGDLRKGCSVWQEEEAAERWLGGTIDVDIVSGHLRGCESDASSRSDRVFCSSTASLVFVFVFFFVSVLRILVQKETLRIHHQRCAGSTLFKCSFLSAACSKVRLIFVLCYKWIR